MRQGTASAGPTARFRSSRQGAFVGARYPTARKSSKVPEAGRSHRATKQTGTPGAKPHYFNAWILLLLGYQDGDTLHDVFPGSGGMERQLQQGVMF